MTWETLKPIGEFILQTIGWFVMVYVSAMIAAIGWHKGRRRIGANVVDVYLKDGESAVPPTEQKS